MKKSVFLLICIIASLNVYAQDIITKSNGDEIVAKVLEVNPDNLKYKLWDYMDGPTYTILKSEILLVKYENGHKDVFAGKESAETTLEGRNETTAVAENIETENQQVLKLNASAPVSPGMRYKQYKKLYNHRMYIPEPGDRYSVGWGGWASFFIPGLGQMINGEGGRGAGYLIGSILCGATTILGANLCNVGVSIDDEGMIIGGLITTICGSVAWLSVDIGAIVDGVRVARIKNMYYQDIQKIKNHPEINVSMQPYVSALSSHIGAGLDTPVAGVSLCITF